MIRTTKLCILICILLQSACAAPGSVEKTPQEIAEETRERIASELAENPPVSRTPNTVSESNRSTASTSVDATESLAVPPKAVIAETSKPDEESAVLSSENNSVDATPAKHQNTVTNRIDKPKPIPQPEHKADYVIPNVQNVTRIAPTGALRNKVLREVSGFSASRNFPGVLYAINDSGDSATLYALGESGSHLGQWSISGARNRDWEDLAGITLNGKHYIVIGDTGDNLKIRRKSTLYLVAEPEIEQFDPNFRATSKTDTLSPAMSIDFQYEDGPRNVEAFASDGRTLYLISKEPVDASGPAPGRLYSLEIPSTQPTQTLEATFLADLPTPRQSLEAKLAAAFAGVNLDHVTALDIDASGRTAYVLSYREVRRVQRAADQNWTQAFSTLGKRIHFHNLGQTEALAIAGSRSVFITSEDKNAPIWAIPIRQSKQQN